MCLRKCNENEIQPYTILKYWKSVIIPIIELQNSDSGKRCISTLYKDIDQMSFIQNIGQSCRNKWISVPMS